MLKTLFSSLIPGLFLFWDGEVGTEANLIISFSDMNAVIGTSAKRSFLAHRSRQLHRSQTSTSLAPAQIMDIYMVSGSNMDQRHQHIFSHQPGLQTMDLNVVSRGQHRPRISVWPLRGGEQGSSMNHRRQSFVET